MTVRKFPAGEYIIRKGEPGSMFYCLEEGIVDCIDIGEKNDGRVEIRGGLETSYFGERALVLNEPRAASVVARTPCTCLVLEGQDFQRVLGPLNTVLRSNLVIRAIAGQAQFAHLAEGQINELAGMMVPKSFSDGQKIVGVDDKEMDFHVVHRGTVTMKGADKDVALTEGQCFGHEAMLEGSAPDFSATASGDVECLVLTAAQFPEAFKTKEGAAQAKQAEERRGSVDSDILISATDIPLADLKFLRALGEGYFGRVHLATHRLTGKSYAIKQMQKKMVKDGGFYVLLKRERDIMKTLAHPLVTKVRLVDRRADSELTFNKPTPPSSSDPTG